MHQDVFSMSIRIQRCHPQVHATHIDFKMSHSLKRSLEAKSAHNLSHEQVDLGRRFQPCRQHALSSATMHCGG